MFPPQFKPMLADKAKLELIKYPCIVSPKIDGFRCLIREGIPYSRNLKPIPNKHIIKIILENKELYEGLDGEIVVGSLNSETVYRDTSSGVMSEDGEPDFHFYAFDRFDGNPLLPYEERLYLVPSELRHEYSIVNSLEELLEKEKEYESRGFEGLMVRSLGGPYKYGRSTANEGYLLKVKKFLDSEAEVIGFEEKMHNANEATVDNLGHTKRSSHKENMIPMNTLGTLTCLLPSGDIFKVGSGFTDAERAEIWQNKEKYMNKIVKYKYTDIGKKKLPRFPTFLGWRDPIDL